VLAAFGGARGYDLGYRRRSPVPQSFVCLYYHIVFSTKRRQPVMAPDMRQRAWDYTGGIIRAEGGAALAVGGTADHVHLLISLKSQPALSDVVRAIKAKSSGWVHDTFPDVSDFWWQPGYGAFAVSYSGLAAVSKHIANQEQHHNGQTSVDEFR
jgi:putative transposase